MRIDFDRTKVVLRMRCPRCHQRSGFVLAGIQQLAPGMKRLLFACTREPGWKHQCGYIVAFEGIIF